MTIEELIARYDAKGFYPWKGSAREIRQLAVALKVAMHWLRCDYPIRENPCHCCHCTARAKIDAIAEGGA